MLDTEAHNQEELSTLNSTELAAMRAAHPNHVDQFMLVRRGWAPLVITDLDPAEIVVKCEGDRTISLYAREWVENMEDDARERSDYYIERLCRAAEEAEKKKQERLAAEEDERAKRKRLEEQVVIDMASFKRGSDAQ